MADVFQMVTDRIISMMEQGEIPWKKPWVGSDLCIKHRNGEPYSLINQFLLGKAGEYLSFKECESEGGKVKKGAKGKFVVFWKMYEHTEKDEDKVEVKTIPILRYYTVFHIDDCEGIEPKQNKSFSTHPINQAETVLNEYTARCNVSLVRQKSGRAFYRPSEHSITLPLIEQFEDVSEYYSTAFHEAIHSTGHHTLLNRFPKDAPTAAFGS